MQKHFLFDDDDPKQRGHGCDVLDAKNPKLLFKWTWRVRKGRKQQPGQISRAILKNGWELKAIFWHSMYEARVENTGEHLTSYSVEQDESTKKRPFLATRLEAQLKAEQLFGEMAKDVMDQWKKVKKG